MKFKVKHDEVKSQLKQLGGENIHSDINLDTYYNHPTRDYKSTDEALRVRETSDQVKLTYKGPKFDSRSKSREEIDIPLQDTSIKQLLERLEFEPSGLVKKERQTWKIDKYTITLDVVEGIGEFLEVELISDLNSDKDATIEELHDFVRKLGLDPDDQIIISYLELVQKNQSP